MNAPYVNNLQTAYKQIPVTGQGVSPTLQAYLRQIGVTSSLDQNKMSTMLSQFGHPQQSMAAPHPMNQQAVKPGMTQVKPGLKMAEDGFVKRAMDCGVPYDKAIELYKLADGGGFGDWISNKWTNLKDNVGLGAAKVTEIPPVYGAEGTFNWLKHPFKTNWGDQIHANHQSQIEDVFNARAQKAHHREMQGDLGTANDVYGDMTRMMPTNRLDPEGQEFDMNNPANRMRQQQLTGYLNDTGARRFQIAQHNKGILDQYKGNTSALNMAQNKLVHPPSLPEPKLNPIAPTMPITPAKPVNVQLPFGAPAPKPTSPTAPPQNLF